MGGLRSCLCRERGGGAAPVDQVVSDSQTRDIEPWTQTPSISGADGADGVVVSW